MSNTVVNRSSRIRILCVVLVSVVCAWPVVRADPLDDLIAARRNGKAAEIDPAKRQEIIMAAQDPASESYREGLAALYLWSIKASIADPERHGGWPFRSFLVFDHSLTEELVQGLKGHFQATPNAYYAYALICPALYQRDEALLAQAERYLKEHDDFLYRIEQDQLTQIWRPIISQRLEREAAEAEKNK